MARAAVELDVGGLSGHPDIDHDVTGAGQRRGEVAGKGDARHADGPDAVDDHVQFVGFTAVGDGDQHIVFCDDPQISVETLDGMEEEGLRPGAGQCRHHLSADQTRFADPGDDHPSGAAVDQFDRPRKILSHPIDQLKNAFRLKLEHLLRLSDGLVFLHEQPLRRFESAIPL
jgi:hypothetical protein